jgi:hypothetical protein
LRNRPLAKLLIVVSNFMYKVTIILKCSPQILYGRFPNLFDIFLLQAPNIFEGISFYLSGDFVASSKGYLQELALVAGGLVLH